MSVHRLKPGLIAVAATLALTCAAVSSRAEGRERIHIAVGRAEVVTSDDDVRTVAIAEPKIADAAVGSARTVVVNGKAPGITTLVIYGQGAHFSVYDVDVYVPNGGRQVQLGVKVAEVDDQARRELGFDLLGTVSNPGLKGVLTGGLYTAKVTNPLAPFTVGPEADGFTRYEKSDGSLKLQATWKALEDKGDIRVLAQPTLVARSGERATFRSGGQIPVPVATTTSGNGYPTVTIEWKDYGVMVDFTPIVEEDSSITLRVDPRVSQLDYSNALTSAGYQIPAIVDRLVSTTVNLKRGENLVIGGLKQTDRVHTVQRVPILGVIPLVGFFFSHTITNNVDHELMIVVAPELIATSAAKPVLPTDRPAGAH
jgi:pilus assembly protein CpaC